MSIFEVGGWAVKAAPVRETTQRLSKKRKRPSDHSKIETAGVNVDKLMEKLTQGLPKTSTSTGSQNAEEPRKKKRKKLHSRDVTKNEQVSVTNSEIRDRESSPTKAKNQHKRDLRPSKTTSKNSKQKAPSDASLTSLQKGMKDSLDGARFRLINEKLYKSDSHEAHKLMRDDPKVFEEYHAGFRHQVLSWPTNPIAHYVSLFASYPPKTVIADLGCGDATLAAGLLPKGISVISFDLVSDGKFVVEADICEKIPLPGSEDSGMEKSSGEGQVIDVVVCALSLMGLNWVNCIREAWRILKPGGQLHIAEVASRFTDIEHFQNLLGSIGFRIKTKDDTLSSHFILFEFIKIPRLRKSEREWVKLLSRGIVLKPCEYKRR